MVVVAVSEAAQIETSAEIARLAVIALLVATTVEGATNGHTAAIQQIAVEGATSGHTAAIQQTAMAVAATAPGLITITRNTICRFQLMAASEG